MQSIPTIDRLVRSRRKTVALVVERDGSLTVRAPLHASDGAIHTFLQQKTDWVRSAQERMRLHTRPKRQYAAGELFYYLGQTCPLEISPHVRPLLGLENGRFLLTEAARVRAGTIFTAWYKKAAAAYILPRVEQLAQQFHLRYSRIRISSARTRWGSCSSRGTLSFTWRLVMAPPEVIDYVILHELAHTRQRNHSAAFWKLVTELMPGYQRQRAWLKQHGGELDLE
jgi:predicted metal-dependent hydrolase